MSKKVAIAVGGTGGHIFPAEALALQLLKQNKDIEILFLGGGLTKNPFFNREAFGYREVPCSNFTLHPIKSLQALSLIVKGIGHTHRVLTDFSPDLVVGFGSYHSFPVLFGAKTKGIPIVLFAADSIPGRVIRLFSPFVKTTAIYFPDAKKHLRGNTKVVGLPIRETNRSFQMSQEECREYFHLDSHRHTLLVFGGSQGAKVLNTQVAEIIAQSWCFDNWQLIHITGSGQAVEGVSEIYKKHNILSCVKPFEENMPLAWKAANGVISRAGASTIAEMIAFEVPGILIPYPFAKDNHQRYNADFLVSEVGGGMMILESEVTSKLEHAIHFFINNGFHHFKESISKYKKNEERIELYQLVNQVLEGR